MRKINAILATGPYGRIRNAWIESWVLRTLAGARPRIHLSRQYYRDLIFFSWKCIIYPFYYLLVAMLAILFFRNNGNGHSVIFDQKTETGNWIFWSLLLYVLGYIYMHVLFWAKPRFRYSIEPFMLIISMYGVIFAFKFINSDFRRAKILTAEV